MSELVKLSAAEMAAKIKAKEVSSRELGEAHLEVIEAAEPSIKAFLKVSGDQALEQADAFDAKSDEEKAALPELAGVRYGNGKGYQYAQCTGRLDFSD